MKAFLSKHPMFLTFLGAAIALVSYVTREGVQEHEKILTSALSQATSAHENFLALFEIRADVETVETEVELSLLPSFEGSRKVFERQMNSQKGLTEEVLDIANGLLSALPHPDPALYEEHKQIETMLAQCDEEQRQFNLEVAGGNVARDLELLKTDSLSKCHLDGMNAANDFNLKVFKEVKIQRSKELRNVGNLTILTYVLFGVSWALGLLGQLSKSS